MLRLSVFVLGFGFVGNAYATNPCVSGDMPGTTPYPACAPSGGAEVCQAYPWWDGKAGIGGVLWSCNLDEGGTTGAVATMVRGYGVNRYSAWGTTTNGRQFCCAASHFNITELEMLGGSTNDTMSFTHASGANLSHPDPLTTPGIGNIPATMRGYGGHDTLFGSHYPGSDYHETLWGDLGNDHIYANSGADTVFGGPGDDKIKGGPGPDDLFGGGGFDCPETEADHDDIICDGSGGDLLKGQDGSDKLWVPEGTLSWLFGDDGTDTCGYDDGGGTPVIDPALTCESAVIGSSDPDWCDF